MPKTWSTLNSQLSRVVEVANSALASLLRMCGGQQTCKNTIKPCDFLHHGVYQALSARAFLVASTSKGLEAFYKNMSVSNQLLQNIHQIIAKFLILQLVSETLVSMHMKQLI